MHDHDKKPEDLLQELGYEPQDIKYKQFLNYALYFLVFFVLSIVAGFAIMYFMLPTRLSGGRMASYEPKSAMPSGVPLLQSNVTTRTDIMSLRKQETERLTTSEVLDEGKGVYRIPVETSIDILSKRGLPKTAAMHEGGGSG